MKQSFLFIVLLFCVAVEAKVDLKQKNRQQSRQQIRTRVEERRRKNPLDYFFEKCIAYILGRSKNRDSSNNEPF